MPRIVVAHVSLEANHRWRRNPTGGTARRMALPAVADS